MPTPHRARRRRILISAALGVSLVLTLQAPGAIAATTTDKPAKPKAPALTQRKETSVDVTAVKARAGTPDADADRTVTSNPSPHWPAPGTAEVALPPAAAISAQQAGTAKQALAQAGSLPIAIGPSTAANRALAAGRPLADSPGKVRVDLLGRTGNQLRIKLTRTDVAKQSGQVALKVDYSAFRTAFGGDWNRRLGLVRLPDCAASTPKKAGCGTGTPLATQNDGVGALTADVPASGVFAVQAAAASDAGSSTSTSLNETATWQAGGQSGDFSWNYPMKAPPSLGGPSPDLTLGYSSGSVDGRTSSANSQASWAGAGFELTPGGSIERRYASCGSKTEQKGNNGTKPVGDVCWATDNATFTLNGAGGELVKDDATGTWHPRNDDGTKVERLYGADNGDGGPTGQIPGAKGEYWVITDKSGTKFYFGLNKIPGNTSASQDTNSTWTVPVFGNNAGEPCNQTAFANSYCDQAYRWNLDYVVDTHGNTMSLFYSKENNNYARNATATTVSTYTRAGNIKRIEYGQADGRVFLDKAVGVVDFTTADRCFTGSACAPSDYPDTPLDQECTSTTNCDNHFYPTFWTKQRLTGVTTSVWRGTSYQPVSSWSFRQSFLDPKDTRSPMLWLDGITNTGLVGGSMATPEVTFASMMLANRVVGADGLPAMNWPRMQTITYGTGGQLTVDYLRPDCSLPDNVPTPDSNGMRCHQIKWTPPGQAERQDWFNKYVVSTVTESDLTTGLDPVTTTVDYLSAPAWHHDDEEGLVEVDSKTWSQWRGYEKVRVTKGSGADAQVTENTYFRGMDGDLKADGTTKDVKVTDSAGTALEDRAPLSGTQREQTTYDGSKIVSRSITDPWVSNATSSRTNETSGTTPATTTQSFIVQQAAVRDQEASGTGWRSSVSSNTYAADGAVATTYDQKDSANGADDTCTRYEYASNTAKGIVDLPTRKQVATGTCDTPPTANNVVSDDRMTYDSGAPTTGNKTKTERLKGWNADGTPQYQTVGTSTYDAQGRVRSTTDALDKTTQVNYSPATGPVTKTTTTLPTGLTTSTELDPAWGEELAAVDQAGRRTDTRRDPLGRVTATFLPGTDRNGIPSTKVSYATGTDKPNVVTTETQATDGTVSTSYDLLDGLMRKRQTQQPAADGDGRIITDYRYDARGLEVQEDGPYYNSAPPGTTVVQPTDPAKLPSRKVTQYDDLGRPALETFYSLGKELWHTSHTNGTGVETIDPPDGEQATTTFTDVEGRTTEIWKYHGSDPTGAYDRTLYSYNAAGKLAKVTDPAGNVWTSDYDVRGRLIRAVEPDKGETKYTYDDRDELLTSTDARNVTLSYTYDDAGRKTAEYQGTTKLAEWVWDTVKPGSLTSSTRYVDGAAYTLRYTGYDNGGRPTGSDLVIPSAEGKLAGTYSVGMTYTPDGKPDTTSLPAVGGLPAENLKIGYDDQGLPSTLTGADTYVRGTVYTPYREVETQAMGRGDNWIQQSFEYEEGTHRLSRASVLTPNQRESDVHYSYDPAGNVTKVTDTPADGTNPALNDTQCFTYDGYRRLTQAWTPSSGDCAAASSKDTLGGPAPYLQSWTFDVVGNRKTQSTTMPAGTTTSTYTYPAAGQALPHAVQKVSETGPDGTTKDKTFGYDARGNQTTHAGDTYAWDAEGHLSTVTSGAAKTSFVYDADGNRLIRRDGSGSTLFIGDTEVLLRPDSSVLGTRYYALGDTPIAVRTGATQLTWLASDHHGTTNLTIDADTLSVQRRRTTPYGEIRGATPDDWATHRGFVGGTEDTSTGLTHLGAREYDAALGKFVSADPVVDFNDPQQLNAYAYANNSPVTFSDADGQRYVYDVVKELKTRIKVVTKRIIEYRREIVTLVVKAYLFAFASMVAQVFHNYALAALFRSEAVKTIVRIRQIVHIVHELVRVLEEVAKTVKRWVPDRAKEIDAAMNGLRAAAESVNRVANSVNALAAAFAIDDHAKGGGGGASGGGAPPDADNQDNPYGQNDPGDVNWTFTWIASFPGALGAGIACGASLGVGCVLGAIAFVGPQLAAGLWNCVNGPHGVDWGACGRAMLTPSPADIRRGLDVVQWFKNVWADVTRTVPVGPDNPNYECKHIYAMGSGC
ncbi:RHS repeat-associated core domain-containing protein [Kribbella sp. GL6]|uniref:RHS repeat domain-containing protein n=1 Tax=Kribbella sp. GL6 TaxID=3419765 RepID=UPI003D015DF5